MEWKEMKKFRKKEKSIIFEEIKGQSGYKGSTISNFLIKENFFWGAGGRYMTSRVMEWC